jgi:hypothetical protein
MPPNPFLALIPESGTAELRVNEHPRPLVMCDLQLRVLSQPPTRPVPGTAGDVCSDPDKLRKVLTCDNCQISKDPPIWTLKRSLPWLPMELPNRVICAAICIVSAAGPTSASA